VCVPLGGKQSGKGREVHIKTYFHWHQLCPLILQASGLFNLSFVKEPSTVDKEVINLAWEQSKAHKCAFVK